MRKGFSYKTVILMALLILFSTVTVGSAYEKIGVSVSIKGKKDYNLKKKAKLLAQKQAIINYLKRASPGAIGSPCEKQLVDDRAALIISISPQEIAQVGPNVEASYLVCIDDEKINYRLEELGCGAQTGATDVVMLIMEEPPSKADISITLNAIDASGTRKLRGLGPFVIYYNTYQRAIRDSIIAGANREGLKLTRLDTLDAFKRMKMSSDDPMVGVYFDNDTEDFVINRRLMNLVKREFAAKDTIILYYRISSLYFDQVSRKLKATIALSLHDLKSGETKSVGSQEFMVMVPKGQPGLAIRDGLADVASSAASLLMNDAQKEARRMASMAQTNARKNGTGTTKVSIQLKSKRAMYKVKRALKPDMVKSSQIIGNSLEVTLAAGVSPDDFVFVQLLDILEGMGIKIPDDNIQLNAQKNIVKQ